MALDFRPVSSRDNPAFKALRALGDDARARRRACACLIDGVHLLEAALDAGWRVSRVAVCEDARSQTEIVALLQRLALAPERPPCLLMPAALFRQLSPVDSPVGILAELALPDAQPASDSQDVVALAGVQDPGNLGSMLRTAAAAGVHQVWLSNGCVDPWSPKVLRAGMGAHFALNIEQGCDLAQRLAATRLPRRVTALAADSVSLYALDLHSPQLWVFGAEGQGVPAELMALADSRVRIPMPGCAESLNVGAAAAVCLFEQVRQRQVSLASR